MPVEQIGPYRVEEQLGGGGMGVVHRCYDARLHRHVAIKSIHPGRELSEARRQRFLHEARTASGLNHANIARVYDVFSEDGRDFIVMEYVRGDSLAALIARGPMGASRVLDLGRQIAEGLAAAHGHGIIHRDLKTTNILVTRDDRIKILDFGVAARLGDRGTVAGLNRDGRVMGTSRSMSPEQARGGELDARSDLFALGSLLYEMATGVHPFGGATPRDTMRRIVWHRPSPPRELDPEIPDGLSLLIEKLLEKAPERRPRSAVDVATTLAALGACQEAVRYVPS